MVRIDAQPHIATMQYPQAVWYGTMVQSPRDTVRQLRMVTTLLFDAERAVPIVGGMMPHPATFSFCHLAKKTLSLSAASARA